MDIAALDLDIELFPNPSSGIVSIKKRDNKTYHLEVLDVNSKLIISKEINYTITDIDLNPYAKGVYIFRLNDGTQVYSIKVVRK